MTTRREVARLAGVSVRTVSNVVTGFPTVAPETRARVMAAITELNYRPSEIARTLKVGRSGLLALMLPELDTPYFAELTRAVVDEGHARGFTVVVDQTDGDIRRERELVTRASRGGIFDAVLMSPLALESEDIDEIMGDSPVVLLGELDYPHHDKVMIDNAAAAHVAVSHLIARGARRIAALGHVEGDRGAARQRLSGWSAAMADHGLPAPAELAPPLPLFGRAAGFAGMGKLLELEDRPDAVFAFSDPIAHGALRALHEHGVRVPDELAIVGFDDNEESAFSIPTLSSVSPDLRWIATTALDLVVRRMREPGAPSRTAMGPFELIVRESSTPSRRAGYGRSSAET
jgi:DNA-binding LacI/PurR family transcriptional regulator